MMKRFAFEERDMARVLLLVSREQAMPLPAAAARGDRVPERAFVCKTCDRVFPSFQALGGHRASHKKPRLDGDGDLKPKLHGCSICGLEFAVGQALGGHMRRHRAMVAGGGGVVTVPPATTGNKPVVSSNAVVGSGGIKRGLWLDLNHPPCDDGNGMDAVTASAATTPPPAGTRSTSSWIPAPWRWTASATSSSPSLAAGFFAGQ